MKMGLFCSSSRLALFLLLALALTVSATEARALPSIQILPQQRYSKVFATLGLLCECCDESGGACTRIRDAETAASCSNLTCLPWKRS